MKNSNVSSYLAITLAFLSITSLVVIVGYILYFVYLFPWTQIYEYAIKEITTVPAWLWPMFVAFWIVSLFLEVSKKD